MVSNGLSREETSAVNDRVNRDILDKLNRVDCTALTLAFQARVKKNTAYRHLIELQEVGLVVVAYSEGQKQFWGLSPRGELVVGRLKQ